MNLMTKKTLRGGSFLMFHSESRRGLVVLEWKWFNFNWLNLTCFYQEKFNKNRDELINMRREFIRNNLIFRWTFSIKSNWFKLNEASYILISRNKLTSANYSWIFPMPIIKSISHFILTRVYFHSSINHSSKFQS